MRKRLNGVRLAALTAGCTALMVAAAGNAVAKTAMKASGSVTLKLVVADYGTGPANTSKKYWQGVATAFEKQNPSIKVAITDIPWTNFDSEVQTMVRNHNYPDITEGEYFTAYAQQGLLYNAHQVLSDPKNLAAGVRRPGLLQGQTVRHALDHQLAHAVLQQEAVRGSGHQVRRQDLGTDQGRRGHDQGQGQERLRAAARPRGGAGRVASVVPG